jgi:hypothetical protein
VAQVHPKASHIECSIDEEKTSLQQRAVPLAKVEDHPSRVLSSAEHHK